MNSPKRFSNDFCRNIRNQAWECFYTVDKARNRHGTGLGIPIARQIAELMQGKVNLESESGQGTRAVMQFPIAKMPILRLLQQNHSSYDSTVATQKSSSAVIDYSGT